MKYFTCDQNERVVHYLNKKRTQSLEDVEFGWLGENKKVRDSCGIEKELSLKEHR